MHLFRGSPSPLIGAAKPGTELGFSTMQINFSAHIALWTEITINSWSSLVGAPFRTRSLTDSASARVRCWISSSKTFAWRLSKIGLRIAYTSPPWRRVARNWNPFSTSFFISAKFSAGIIVRRYSFRAIAPKLNSTGAIKNVNLFPVWQIWRCVQLRSKKHWNLLRYTTKEIRTWDSDPQSIKRQHSLR